MTESRIFLQSSGQQYLLDVVIQPITVSTVSQRLLEPLESPGVDGRRYRDRGLRPQTTPLRALIGARDVEQAEEIKSTFDAISGQLVDVAVQGGVFTDCIAINPTATYSRAILVSRYAPASPGYWAYTVTIAMNLEA